MMLPRLYAVTDESVTPDASLIDAVGTVLDAGVRLVQVRFKSSEPDVRFSLGNELRRITTLAGALLIVNDHPELAAEIRADGVHLGAKDPSVDDARRILGASAIVGVSAYDQLERVQRWGSPSIDYLGMSSPYTSPLKTRKAVPPVERFRALVEASSVPVYGIGGVTPEKVEQLVGFGCHGVAAVSAIFAAQDPGLQVRRFNELLG